MTTTTRFTVEYRDESPSETVEGEYYDIAEGWILFFEDDRATTSIRSYLVRKVTKAKTSDPRWFVHFASESLDFRREVEAPTRDHAIAAIRAQLTQELGHMGALELYSVEEV